MNHEAGFWLSKVLQVHKHGLQALAPQALLTTSRLTVLGSKPSHDNTKDAQLCGLIYPSRMMFNAKKKTGNLHAMKHLVTGQFTPAHQNSVYNVFYAYQTATTGHNRLWQERTLCF